MISVVGVSWIYVKCNFKDSTSMSFSPWLFVLGTFFEETSSTPSKLEKETFYRLSIGIWCLMVVFLTNCYNSLMITGLNSPLPGIKIESFQDLLCDQSLFEPKNQQGFNITQWLETTKVNLFWNRVFENIKDLRNPYESSACFRIWSPESVSENMINYRNPFNDLFWKLLAVYTDDVYEMKELTDGGTQPGLLPYSDKIMWSLLHPGHPREPGRITEIRIKEKRVPTKTEVDIANQLEITKSGHKSAYILNSNMVGFHLNFLLRNFEANCYAGKEMIRQEREGMTIKNIRNTNIPTYYGWLISSGIYERLQVEKVAK
jgi:hypothetical protein